MNIAALISGGVDSAVAVHLLCEQGYKPDLFYIKIGMDTDDGLTCTAEEDIELASATERKYGLSFHIVDLQQAYWDNVVAYTVDRVRRGLTPNPDVMCNKLIKFGCFDREAGQGYDKIATGHYASTLDIDGYTWLATAKDPVKDQTVVMAALHVFEKIGDSLGRLLGIELEHNVAGAGLHLDQGIGGSSEEGVASQCGGEEEFLHGGSVLFDEMRDQAKPS